MNREEAIKWLKAIEKKYIHGGDEEYDNLRKTALHMAIESLEQPEPQWIPVSEGLPEELTTVLITDKDGDVFLATFIEVINGCAEWTTDGVIAWMPLPEPYKERWEEHD